MTAASGDPDAHRDQGDSLSRLQDLVLEFREARDWRRFHTPKNLAAALAIEAAELQELFLWRTDAEIRQDLGDPAFLGRVREELADILIFLLYLAEAGGVDLAAALRDKVEKNAGKYPIQKSYGSHKKYTEL